MFRLFEIVFSFGNIKTRKRTRVAGEMTIIFLKWRPDLVQFKQVRLFSPFCGKTCQDFTTKACCFQVLVFTLLVSLVSSSLAASAELDLAGASDLQSKIYCKRIHLAMYRGRVRAITRTVRNGPRSRYGLVCSRYGAVTVTGVLRIPDTDTDTLATVRGRKVNSSTLSR